jgi:uncharacterized protein
MYRIDLLRLREGINPLKVVFTGDTALFDQLDIELTGKGVLEGSIDKRDDNLFIVNASINVPVKLTCRRCLEDFKENIEADFILAVKRESEREEESTEGEDILYVDMRQDEVDLEEFIREHIILNLPNLPLCGEDCKGLCAGCGVDLNNKNCNCAG